MSSPARDTLHAARLLQNKLVRAVQRRQRQLDQAQSDYRVALLLIVSEADPSTIDIVQRALDNDRSAPDLAADLHHAYGRRPAGIIDGEFAEIGPGPETEDLPPPLHRDRLAEESAPLTPRVVRDGNEEWGLPSRPSNGPAKPIGDTLADTLPGYRYPEPGEPARQLADGRIVAATVADEAPAET